MEDRIKFQMDNYHDRHQQELVNNPSLEKSSKWWKSEVKLLDAMLARFQTMTGLNDFEKASLRTATITREQYMKNAHPSKLYNILHDTGRFLTRTPTKVVERTGDFLTGRVNRYLARQAHRSNWMWALLLQGLRLAAVVIGKLLQWTGKLLGWVVDKMLPSRKVPKTPKPAHRFPGQALSSQQRQQRDRKQGKGIPQEKAQQQQQVPTPGPARGNGQGKDLPPPGPLNPAEHGPKNGQQSTGHSRKADSDRWIPPPAHQRYLSDRPQHGRGIR
jgi:hypothetical protein